MHRLTLAHAVAVQGGIGVRRGVVQRFEVREDSHAWQRFDDLFLDLLQQAMPLVDGPPAGHQDVEGDEAARPCLA